jgi:GDPmannose 4,6-dehydratase
LPAAIGAGALLMLKRALITGVNGQDGAYLANLLLNRGYEVIGTLRPTSNIGRLVELGIQKSVQFVTFESSEFVDVLRLIEKTHPDELYNFASQSFVGSSFDRPIHTGEVNAMGAARLLEAIRIVNPKIRYYQASSSEMFGNAAETPQSETTPFRPRSPYGVAKLYAHWMTVNYRKYHQLHASSGIAFNHESPLRGKDFVTRKITLSLACIKYSQLDVLELGNLDAQRDWGFAGDFVEAIWQMVQREQASDYVLASGQTHLVRDFIVAAARHLGFKIEWQGEGIEECGIDRTSGRVLVRTSRELYRAAEAHVLCGDPTKAEQELGWKRRVSFGELVDMMAEADERRVREARVLF